ncbi:MAG: adenine phosphoribosyltransferase [Jaaginema sp. PMC 1079.18]|nr:adenine phosphoribosyltransferase [Jaaginema sp. PMC 1080.18]MEC4851779.1 adenine phosphoribosyltransferase [Jaaginema sp. PMC 1079.18]MEC4866719.1 adenine phosphoribosyltransferase [Jaaginema sp. PMC 1078.18]
MNIRDLIRDIPDFPKPGILFRDITTLLQDPQGLSYTIDCLYQKCTEAGLTPDYVVGIESRGFIFAPSLAYKLNAGFVPVRKAGKLPAAVHTVEYDLEYGTDRLQIHQDAFPAGAKVLIVDDLMATGGTAAAAAELVVKAGGELIGLLFLIELVALGGRSQVQDVPVITLVEY